MACTIMESSPGASTNGMDSWGVHTARKDVDVESGEGSQELLDKLVRELGAANVKVSLLSGCWVLRQGLNHRSRHIYPIAIG